MQNLPTSEDQEGEGDSPILSVRLTPEWKWALRKIATDAAYRSLSDFIVALLKQHTDMETVALSYPRSRPDTLNGHP